MLYYFFALLTAGIVLLMNNIRRDTNRWAALFLVSASIGGIADQFQSWGLPMWAQTARLINHVMTPYGLLIFCLLYSGLLLQARMRMLAKLLLLVPVMGSVVQALLTPELNLDYRWLLVWTAPYYLLACMSLVVSLWRENNRRKKRNKLITTLIIVPTVLAVLLFINVAKVFYPDFAFFRYISIFIIYSLGAAVLCTFLYGVLGVKLRFEHEPLESTMKAVSTGTTMLNHSLKNEIGKIAISTENLRSSSNLDKEALEQLQIIAAASDHMLTMVGRIHSQMRDFHLQEEPCRLDHLVAEALQHIKPLAGDKIHITAQYNYRPFLLCDAVHVRESLNNVLENAIEAMPAGGELTVELDRVGNEIALRVRDEGSGISEDHLNQLFEPFFSTKNRKLNFGLGLSYVYNVMQKSGGRVDISSKLDKGTVVTLLFPAAKLLHEADREIS